MNWLKYPENQPEPGKLHLIATSSQECFVSGEIRDDVYEIKVSEDILALNELYVRCIAASLCIPKHIFDKECESTHKMAMDELLKHD